VKIEVFSSPQNASAEGGEKPSEGAAKPPAETDAKPPVDGHVKTPPEAAAKPPADDAEKKSKEATAKPSAEAAAKPPAVAATVAPAEVPDNGAPAALVPVGAPPAAAEAPVAGGVTVTFQKSGKPAPLPPDKSILEASEDVGVNIDFECRVGTCGRCKMKLLSGAVTMAVEDALSAAEKASGMILVCQAKSTADCAVDA
jgi:ferredoxin